MVMDEKVMAETPGHKSSKALSTVVMGIHLSRVLNEIRNTDSTGTSSKDTMCLLSEALDEEQSTETKCETISVKEETQIMVTTSHLSLYFQIKHFWGCLVTV